jgi:uncharacterized SAM-binding protein YcdF (DUF218 family)
VLGTIRGDRELTRYRRWRRGRHGSDGGRGGRASWRRWLLRGSAALVALIVLVVVGTAALVWHTGRTDDRRQSDVIVVMGAAQYDGEPSEIFAARLDHAAALWRAHVSPRIVTIGGNRPGDRFTEASAGARYLERHGVPAEDVVQVPAGSDTLLSLRATAVELRKHGWKTAVLVTDPWHSLRSRQMARDLSIDAVTSPVHSGPAVRGRTTEMRYIARETAAYLFYRLFHRVSPPGPGAV